jgi:hypothetical protein
MRLGFVGVGRWATKLATAFRACGAEIVAYDRRSAPVVNGSSDLDGFGKLLGWRNQITDKSIDAIVAVATPEITTEVALACSAAGKPVMATKPLLAHPERLTAPFWTDFWRLYASSHLAAFESLRRDARQLTVALHGNGPFRSFPGLLDYGPHVMAMLLHVARGEPVRIKSAEITERHNDGKTYTVAGSAGDVPFVAVMGNGSEVPVRELRLGGQTVSQEDGIAIGNCTKAFVLERFCAHFLADVSEQTVDPQWLRLSRDGLSLLRRVQEMSQ